LLLAFEVDNVLEAILAIDLWIWHLLGRLGLGDDGVDLLG